MNVKSSEILNFLTLEVIIISAILGYLDVISTLFYFTIEAAVIVLITILMYFQKGDPLKGVQIGFMSLLPIGACYLFSYFPVVFMDSINSELDAAVNSSKEFLPYMLNLCWPFIVLKLITSLISYFLTKKEEREEAVMNNLITPIFLLMGIGVVNISLLELFENQLKATTILIVILSVRVLVELLQYKSILGIVIFNKKK